MVVSGQGLQGRTCTCLREKKLPVIHCTLQKQAKANDIRDAHNSCRNFSWTYPIPLASTCCTRIWYTFHTLIYLKQSGLLETLGEKTGCRCIFRYDLKAFRTGTEIERLFQMEGPVKGRVHCQWNCLQLLKMQKMGLWAEWRVSDQCMFCTGQYGFVD